MDHSSTKKLTIEFPKGTKVPNHIAIILDGNRRWARARKMKPWEGHAAGYQAVKRVAKASRNLGVHTFTAWAFSTENWERPKAEVDELIRLLRKALHEVEEELHRERIRLVHLGRKDRLPSDVIEVLTRMESETVQYGQHHVFNIGLDYGGHDEIVRMVQKIITSGVDAGEVDEKMIERSLDTADQPYPYVDLFIRTSGEQRTSGLMPWQMHYAEFYWEQDHLPDFTTEKLREAILDYSRRRRRFGGNDVEGHMKFDPKALADLELAWRRELANGSNRERLRDLMANYAKELYGFSKDLAKEAGFAMANAVLYGRDEEWGKAKQSLKGLYGIVKRALQFAFDPETIADLEVLLWRNGKHEHELKTFFAEKFRISVLQASKSAHLAALADIEIAKQNWKQAHWYLEKCYEAIKERVA